MALFAKNKKTGKIAKLDPDIFIKETDNYEFLLKEDDNIEAYNNGKDADIKIHNCVLPQPYFGKKDKGNNEKEKIVFLAKNPAYEDFKDKQDTYQYLKNHGGDISKYSSDLENVNFFKPWYIDENISFINTWNWWNKKVFGNIKIKNEYIDNVSFVNVCGYPSKYFDKTHYEEFKNPELDEILKNADFVFVVWGGVKNINDVKKLLKKDKHIVLNLNNIENDKEKYVVNINSLETILKANKYFDKIKKEETVKVNKEEKKKYEKMQEIYGDKMNFLDKYFSLKEENEG